MDSPEGVDGVAAEKDADTPTPLALQGLCEPASVRTDPLPLRVITRRALFPMSEITTESTLESYAR
jgi:hypothetical protein